MNAERGEVPSNIGPDVERETTENIEPETVPGRASDMEAVSFLNSHIDNPCGVEVSPGRTENIREFYIREANKLLPNLSNPHAKRLLEMKIEEYTKD